MPCRRQLPLRPLPGESRPTRPSLHAAVSKAARPAREHRQGRKDALAGGATALRPRGRDAGSGPGRRGGRTDRLAASGRPGRARSRLRRPLRLVRLDRRRTAGTRGPLPPPDSAGPLPAGEPTGQPVGLRQATRPGPGGLGRGIPGPRRGRSKKHARCCRWRPAVRSGGSGSRRCGNAGDRRYGVLREAVAELLGQGGACQQRDRESE